MNQEPFSFSDLLSTPRNALSVSQLTNDLKHTLEQGFSDVWVRGEISNYRPASSGHIYFSLKDENACLAVAVFRWSNTKTSFSLKEGMEILCKGKISIFGPRGTYQLIAEHLEPLGVGALQIAFEQLKKKLQQEGLFDSARKKPLPNFVKSIAVITSPTGAVIQDILNILKRRAAHINVILVPCVVQGEQAVNQLIRAIEIINTHMCAEVIILARGGGSQEDLWCFNHESLARAIFSSRLPIISAIGHETDFTISDFVSDLRAPTPSAAAEIISHSWIEISPWIQESSTRLKNQMLQQLRRHQNIFANHKILLISPADKIRQQAQALDDCIEKLHRTVNMKLQLLKVQLVSTIEKIEALSPLSILRRGYAFLKTPNGSVVKSIAHLHTNDVIELVLHDGTKNVQVL